MSRIVRERGSMGRRLWRRRIRKRGEPLGTSAEGGPSDGSADGADTEDGPGPPPFSFVPDVRDDDVRSEPARNAVGTQAKKGLLSSLKERFFGGGSAPAAQATSKDPGYLATDPVGDVLSVPRGAARLDAFERALQTASPGHPVHRDLALAFFRELSSLAEHAGLDLSLLEGRVDACAQALLAANEDERAGTLFLRMGARHRAVDVFVRVGALDALEEVYAQIQWDEGGVKHEARLAFERFESLFAVGMREAALVSLERAVKLWGDNPVFTEVHQAFIARIGAPHRHLFKAGRKELLLSSRWPIVIGRGEDVAVRLTSPLLSRTHLQLVQERGGVVVRDLDSKGGTRVDGAPLEHATPLGASGAIDMGGVVVRYERNAECVTLVPAISPERATWALLGPVVTLPTADGTPSANVVRIDGLGRAILQRGGTLNGELLTRDTLLLEGDIVGTWTVVRA